MSNIGGAPVKGAIQGTEKIPISGGYIAVSVDQLKDYILQNFDPGDIDISEIEGRITTLETKVTQNSAQIQLRATKTELDTLTGRVTIAESTINQTASQIELKVSKTDYNGDTIMSMINLSPSAIKISASKINMVGAVTFESLAPNFINDLETNSELATKGYVQEHADGQLVYVQYSANGTDWHNVYVNGDKYMRQKVGLSGTWTIAIQITGTNGTNGKSAYQLAVDNGFVGTEAEWLASLNGQDGTGIAIKGSVADNAALAALPTGSLVAGDSYLVISTGLLHIWDGTSWSAGFQFKGDPGAPGTSSYLHVAYANSIDGTVNFSTAPFPGATFIGMLVNTNPVDSTNPADYAWTGFRGEPMISSTEPTDKYIGMVWIDTSKTPAEQKYWTGTVWQIVGMSSQDAADYVYLQGLIAQAKAGKTIIIGGYFNNQLVDTNTLVVRDGVGSPIGTLIENNKIRTSFIDAQAVLVGADVITSSQLNTALAPVSRTFTDTNFTSSYKKGDLLIPNATFNLDGSTFIKDHVYRAIADKSGAIWSPSHWIETTSTANEVVVPGTVNLLRRKDEQRDRQVDSSGNIATVANSSYSIYPIDVLPGEKISFKKTTGSGIDVIAFKYTDASNNFLSRVAFNNNLNTLTVPTGAYKIFISYPTSSQVMVVRGGAAGDWSPSPYDVQADIVVRPALYINTPSGYNAKDMWIPAIDTTIGSTLFKGGIIYLANASRYTGIVASEWDSPLIYNTDSAVTLDYLTDALQDGQSALIGGLILTSLIAVRDSSTLVVKSYMSGQGSNPTAFAAGVTNFGTVGETANVRINHDGSVNFANGKFVVSAGGAVSANSVTCTNLNITGSIFYGDVYAANGTFSGTITSNAGTIGGWNITSSGISVGSGDGYNFIFSNGQYQFADNNGSFGRASNTNNAASRRYDQDKGWSSSTETSPAFRASTYYLPSGGSNTIVRNCIALEVEGAIKGTFFDEASGSGTTYTGKVRIYNNGGRKYLVLE